MSREDRLQFPDGIGRQSHGQGCDVHVPVLAMLLSREVLLIRHLKIHSLMMIAVADEARPRTGAKYHWQVGRVRTTPSQKAKQVMQLNGLRLAKGKA